MRRRLTRILIYLIIGAVTTVLVAWENLITASTYAAHMTHTDAMLSWESTGWPAQSLSRGWGWYDGVLPLTPLFPGFLIDALFYGILWFGLFFGFGAARRTLRKKRGLCPICAYDLRGHTDPHPRPLSQRERGVRCPECGWNRSDDQPPGEAGG